MVMSIKDIKDLAGKRVLVRVDFNTPTENGKVTDNTRIKEALPTITYLTDQGAKVILLSHRGRPKGEINDSLRLSLVGEELQKLVPSTVKIATDCIGEAVEAQVTDLNEGEILLLENLRFHKEETENNDNFAAEIAKLGDLFVQDAFGVVHRAHASTEAITNHLPSVAGFLIEKELEFLGRALKTPEHPFIALVGGAKVSSKLEVLENLLDKVDTLIVAGGMIFTFLKAQGLEVGTSLLEPELVDSAKAFLEKAKNSKTKLLLPVDQVVALAFDNNAQKQTVDSNAIPSDMMGLDIGPRTIVEIKDCIKTAKTILWNGPMGVFEMPNFASGTFEVAKAIAENQNATSIIGGGDSALAAARAGVSDQITHISTGGGAALEFLEGKTLPGLAALQKKG